MSFVTLTVALSRDLLDYLSSVLMKHERCSAGVTMAINTYDRCCSGSFQASLCLFCFYCLGLSVEVSENATLGHEWRLLDAMFLCSCLTAKKKTKHPSSRQDINVFSLVHCSCTWSSPRDTFHTLWIVFLNKPRTRSLWINDRSAINECTYTKVHRDNQWNSRLRKVNVLWVSSRRIGKRNTRSFVF